MVKKIRRKVSTKKTKVLDEPKITFSRYKEGFTIWVNGLWVLDASMFKIDKRFTIDAERIKELKSPKWEKNREFILK